ncbi:MAG: hypothetical protein AAGG75_18910 [Bacteroidota bacterium]
MAEGKFFIRNKEQRSAVFRYKLVKVEKANDDFAYPEYPLFVTLTKERVTFAYHGLLGLGDKVSNGIQQAAAVTDPPGALPEKVAIYELFHLDLNQLLNAQGQADWVAEDLCYELIPLYQKCTNTPNPHLSFYDVTTEEAKKVIKTNAEAGLFNIAQFSHKFEPLKQYHLFLDFLLDFFHSRVFKDFVHYQRIKKVFLQNPVISGIYAKCNFYYSLVKYHHLIKETNQELKDIEQTLKANSANANQLPKSYLAELEERRRELKNFVGSEVHKNSILQLAEAESFWIEKILDPQNISLFASRNPWFHNSEKEMELANAQNVNGPVGKEWKTYIKFFFKKRTSHKNIVSRAIEWGKKKWAYYFQGAAKEEKNRKDVFSRFFQQCQKQKKEIVTYWIKRYDIYHPFALNLLLKRWIVLRRLSPRYRRLLITGLFLLGPLLLLLGCPNWFAFDQELSPFLFYGSHAMLSFALLGGFVVFAPILIFGIGVIVAVATLPFFWVKKLASPRYLLPSVISASLPRMQLGIISGWVIFATSDDLWKLNYDIDPKSVGLFAIFTFLLSLYFVCNEVLREAPDIRHRTIITRGLVILFLGFSVSSFIGVTLMHFEGKKMIKRIPEIKQKYYLAEVDWLKKKNLQLQGRLNDLSRLNDIVVGYHNYHRSPETDQEYLKHIYAITSKNPLFWTDSIYKDLKTATAPDQPQGKIAKVEPKLVFSIQERVLEEITHLNDSITAISEGLIQLQSQVENEDQCFQHFIENSSTTLFADASDAPQIKEKKKVFPMSPLTEKENDSILNHLIQKNPLTQSSPSYYVFQFSILSSDTKYEMYPLLLYFNSVLALFVGLFVQLLLQQTNITDPI